VFKDRLNNKLRMLDGTGRHWSRDGEGDRDGFWGSIGKEERSGWGETDSGIWDRARTGPG